MISSPKRRNGARYVMTPDTKPVYGSSFGGPLLCASHDHDLSLRRGPYPIPVFLSLPAV
jgi:hypothetical protein